jgi:hypothetical protein
MINYLDKNSQIKSSLNLRNDNFLNSEEIDKIKSLIVDTQTINKYYFEEKSINNKTYKLNEEYQNLSYSFDCQEEEFEGETFKDYPQDNEDLTIKVSNLGRIRINGEIAEQVEEYENYNNYNKEYRNVGYLQLKHPSDNENINKAWRVIEEKYVYEMVAKVWLGIPDGEERWEVHHITNNGYDNRDENLIWVKKSDHIKIHSK